MTVRHGVVVGSLLATALNLLTNSAGEELPDHCAEADGIAGRELFQLTAERYRSLDAEGGLSCGATDIRESLRSRRTGQRMR